MIIPGEELHWRFVSISIRVPRSHLDPGVLRGTLDLDGSGTRLEASDALTSQTHAYFYPAPPREPGDADEGEHVIQIDTYRFENEDSEEQLRRISDSGFFDVLRTGIQGLDQLEIISVADLHFPASTVAWRMKMLASPPTMEEFQSEIGKISLSGVKLRFSDSPHGLLESSLEISPDEDEYRCSLTVLTCISPDRLGSVHTTVLNRAEEFAQLFVEVKGGA
ncbi:MAG: hypothetical protein LC667_07470 [Thioalkalivibrio sp.]|nr:hypothetical protein [Thioalkalivibrio sp.]